MDAIKQMCAHRSIRKYKPDPVPDDALNRIVEAALRASSSGNMQTISVIVTKDAERRKTLWDLHLKQDMILQAPLLLTFCADWNRMNKWCLSRDAAPGFDNFLCYMVAAGDAFIASQNAALAAESLGLGICYMGTTLCNAPALAKFFRCPKDVVPVTTLVVGYPDEDPPVRDRLPVAAIVHHETYKDYDADAIATIYKEREVAGWNRYKSFPQLFEKVKAAGVKNLAQIYTQVKYTKKENESFSEGLLTLLREKGFIPAERA